MVGVSFGEGSVDGEVAAAVRAACRLERSFDVVWVGDSISELNATRVHPLPWQVGDLLMGRNEPVQYRNATDDEYSRPMTTEGTTVAPELAGFAGRTSRLEPGQTASITAAGESVRVLWSRRPGGGDLVVRWGDEQLGAIATDGPPACSQLTRLDAWTRLPEASLTLEALGAPVELEGVYVHHGNGARGVRIWPAVRSGSRSRDFTDHRGWALDAVGSIGPDLVVLATGTNDGADYEVELGRLIDAVRREDPEVAVVVWLPPLSDHYTPAQATIGREVARRAGCGIIDAAGHLGELPTVDTVHPTPFTVAMASHHAAGALRGEPAGEWVRTVADAFAAAAIQQQWRPALGSISIEDAFFSTALVGRTGEGADEAVSWVISGPPASEGVLGLEGPVFTMGPGGGEPTDTHLSRLGSGTFAINGGHGELAVGALRIGPRDGSNSSGVVLELDDAEPTPRLVTRTADGVHHPVRCGGAGLELPLPCALAAHVGTLGSTDLEAGRVLWVPFPPLATRATVTHVWLDVVDADRGAAITAAVLACRDGGLPGTVLAATRGGAIDGSCEGIGSGALTHAVAVPMHTRWWVALALDEGSRVSLRGARSLVAPLPVHLGVAPVGPDAGELSGAFVTSAPSIVDHPVALDPHVGVAPTVHVSLEGASHPHAPSSR